MRHLIHCFRKLALLLPAVLLFSQPAAQAAGTPAVSDTEAKQIAFDAYTYGYSLITTEITRIQMSNVPRVEELRAPMGKFFHIRSYPPADYRGVSAANADTLYSVAWLDLSEPQVFTHPAIPDRFFTFELVDLWMTVKNSVGTNTGDDEAMTYLFTGPDWDGEVPEGMTHVSFPTRYMVILGRTYSTGTESDIAKVNALQDQYELVPLSSYGKPYEYEAPQVDPDPGFSMTKAPQKVILDMSTREYFNRMTQLMATAAPPAPQDEAILERMAKIGIVPGQPFDPSMLSPEVQSWLEDLPQLALQKFDTTWKELGTNINGWRVTRSGGVYGTDYTNRAAWAAYGWPSQLPSVSVYPTTYVDSSGQQLKGADNYTLTFPAGELPPVRAFWSITMYTIDSGLWFYPNPLGKQTVSPRNDLQFNEDGSLTLYFQHDSPGADMEANWLPAPEGPFALTLRMYWPKTNQPSILDGSWDPPAVVRTGAIE